MIVFGIGQGWLQHARTAGTAGIAHAGARRRSSSDYAELPGVQPAIPFSSPFSDALRHAGKNEIQQLSAFAGYGETRTRTGDTTIFSRVLYQLSYLAVAALEPSAPR